MFDRFNAWVGSLYVRSQDLKKEDGQTFVEYALVLSVIVVAVLLGTMWLGLGGAIQTALTKIENAIKGTPATPAP
jgi:Flp pilus assembly pilin Flp